MTEKILSRREFLNILWVIAFILLIITCVGVSYWYIIPRAEPVQVANIANLIPYHPVLRSMDSNLSIYLVQFDGELRAWDVGSPVSGCIFRWNGVNNRFEDPCSGAKWCIDGTIADRRIKDATSLQGYGIDVSSDGQILVDPQKVIRGEALPIELRVSDPMDFQHAREACLLP